MLRPVASSIARIRSIVSTLRCALRSHVVPDRSPEPRVAELAAQHVQHRAAFLIEVAVEDLDRVAKGIADDRAAVTIRLLFQIRAPALEDVVQILVVAEIGFAPDRFHVRGEAFVEPGVRPVAAGEQIAEPLVRQLVRNQRIAREIEMRRFVVQRPIGLRRRRRVLHAAEDEIARRRFASSARTDTARPCAARTFRSFAASCRTNVRRPPRGPAGRSTNTGTPFSPGRALLNLDERSRDHRHQVGAVRNFLPIAKDRAVALVLSLDQLAVAEREGSLRNRRSSSWCAASRAGNPNTETSTARIHLGSASRRARPSPDARPSA